MSGPVRALGIGFSSRATAATIVELAQSVVGASGGPATAIATLDAKAGDPRLVEAARVLNLPIVPIARQAIVAAEVPTPSDRAEMLVGLRSVAEAAALAATGPNARLVLKKRIGRGCTAALAEGRP